MRTKPQDLSTNDHLQTDTEHKSSLTKQHNAKHTEPTIPNRNLAQLVSHSVQTQHINDCRRTTNDCAEVGLTIAAVRQSICTPTH